MRANVYDAIDVDYRSRASLVVGLNVVCSARVIKRNTTGRDGGYYCSRASDATNATGPLQYGRFRPT